jgi:hypothetical protein
VLPVNPDLVARRRGPAKKKDDSEDARTCALMALDAYLDLRQLIPHGEAGTELRAIARAPVTRRSGRSEFTVARRLAYNRHLGEAVQQWAFCSLTRSAWAREFYDEKTAAGDSHHAALRKLGNRWLEVLWHCLHKGVLYDEAVHAASRKRSRPPAAAA